MSTYTMGLQLGAGALGAATDFLVASEQAKMRENARKHNNAMRAISAGEQVKALERKGTATKQAAARAMLADSIVNMQDRASAEVSAAAAGVAGGSVEAVMRDIERSALYQQGNRLDSHENAQRAIEQEKQNVRLQSVMGENVSVVGKPSLASSVLGLGISSIGIYDQHQPEGQQTSDVLASLFK